MGSLCRCPPCAFQTPGRGFQKHLFEFKASRPFVFRRPLPLPAPPPHAPGGPPLPLWPLLGSGPEPHDPKSSAGPPRPPMLVPRGLRGLPPGAPKTPHPRLARRRTPRVGAGCSGLETWARLARGEGGDSAPRVRGARGGCSPRVLGSGPRSYKWSSGRIESCGRSCWARPCGLTPGTLLGWPLSLQRPGWGP